MNEGERLLCEYQFGRTGDFFTALIDAMFKADEINLAKLRKAFPELARAVWAFKDEEGYWKDLKEEWELEHQ